jgi:hypothetical protein
VVLPLEARSQADQFLQAVAQEVAVLSNGYLRLVGATENLGDWAIVGRDCTRICGRSGNAGGQPRGSAFELPIHPPVDPAIFPKSWASASKGLECGGGPRKRLAHPAGEGKYTWPVACR